MSTDHAPEARLRTVNDVPPSISAGNTSNDGMMVFLLEPGNPTMVARIGMEKVQCTRPAEPNAIEVTRGETFRIAGNNHITGGRYLMRGPTGQIFGALNYTLRREDRREHVVLSNLAVASGMRRLGIASRLLEELLRDYPSARADTSMTADGAAFMGYAPRNAAGAPTANVARSKMRR